MNSTQLGTLVFICSFGGALLGIYLRSKLPPDHLDGDSKDVVKLVMGLVATMAALVLSLLISTAHTAYDAQEAEIGQLGVHVFQLDHVLTGFGPAGAPARSVLRKLVAEDLARTWPQNGAQASVYAPAQQVAEADQLIADIAALPANTSIAQMDQSRALSLLNSISETRRLMSVQSRASVSWFVLAILVCWLTLLFFGFGLFASLNRTVVMALIAGALSVATACVLILDMSQPYRGWMTVSSAPIRDALQQMQH